MLQAILGEGATLRISRVEQPQLPHHRKVPKRYDSGLASPEFHESPMLYYCQYYFEAIDLIVNCIKNWFDQPDYHMYCQLELLLLKACQKKDFTSWALCCMYFFKEDLNQDQLQAQLLTLTSLIMLHLLWVLSISKNIFSFSLTVRGFS